MYNNILIASDSFKSSLSSGEICHTLSKTLINSSLPIQITTNKLADGGEGTLAAINQKGDYKVVNLEVDNPLFSKINTHYLYDLQSKTAFVELAQASGLTLVQPTPNIMHSSTYGTGSLIRHAIENGATEIILFVGGSATNDAGLGILEALGFNFLDKKGSFVKPLPKNLMKIHTIDDTNSVFTNKNISVTIAADVTNPFYGENGASYCYAQQKGATIEDIKFLDKAFHHLADLFLTQYNTDIQNISGSGAAGGVAGGLCAVLGAEIVSGAGYIFNLLDIENKIANSDLVISGEGKIDNQSLNNKLLFAIAKLVKQHNKKLWAICGFFDGNNQLLKQLNISKVFPFARNSSEIEYSILNADKKLDEIAHDILKELQ